MSDLDLILADLFGDKDYPGKANDILARLASLHNDASMAPAMSASKAADYPRPVERLGPIVPGRAPLDHVHIWTYGPKLNDGLFCRDCGQWENTKA